MSVAGYKRGIFRNSQQWRFKSRGLPERRPRLVWTVPYSSMKKDNIEAIET